MNFRPELAAKVMAGEKTVTRRPAVTKPRSPWYEGGCALKVGRDYAVCPGRGKPAIGRARVVSVRLEPLSFLSNDEARAEGFEDHARFEDAWQAIHGGDYRHDALVWRVELEALR